MSTILHRGIVPSPSRTEDINAQTVAAARAVAEQARNIGLRGQYPAALKVLDVALGQEQEANRLLLNACRAIDADIELTGAASEASISMLRTALKSVNSMRLEGGV